MVDGCHAKFGFAANFAMDKDFSSNFQYKNSKYKIKNYTVFQKRCHQTHGGNFVKSQPIFKILSPLKIEGNFQ